MTGIQYKRLTWSRARTRFAIAAISRTSLWLGDDHLLFVETNGFTETYKRFYFRDIQALIMQKTRTGLITNMVLYALLVLVTMPALISEVRGLKIFFFTLTGIFGVILLVNLLRGQTCRTFLRTAVQIEQLPPLSRVRRARKIFARIRPLIAAAQGGELSPQTASDRLREQVMATAAPSAVTTDSPDVPPGSAPENV